MDHNITYTKGTHSANHIARCSCGWAAADLFKQVRQRAEFHTAQNNPFAWDDKRRLKQTDKDYPPFRPFRAEK